MKPFEADPENVDKIIKATVVLHNFIMSCKNNNTNRYALVDEQDQATALVGIRMGARNSTAVQVNLGTNMQNIYSHECNQSYIQK